MRAIRRRRGTGAAVRADTRSMAATRTRVYVVDDLPSMRARLAELLHEIDGVDIVGEAGDPEAAIAGILDQRPEFVLLDYQLEGGTALDVLRVAHAQVPDTVFIVLTNHASPPYRRACTKAGAQYFFDKSSEFGRISTVISGLEPAPH
jgi:DNA-binding NarL/FixJ family response regulator